MTKSPAPQPQRVENPFAPVFDHRSRVLILGTMPSPGSRAQGFYYGHPQNRFWPVMAQVLGWPLPTDTQQKRRLLLENHIALWDVLASCEMHGAADSSIRRPVVNNLHTVLSAAPIAAIVTNGRAAEGLYRRHCMAVTGIAPIALPSTSPANARWSKEALAECYRVLLAYLPAHTTP